MEVAWLNDLEVAKKEPEQEYDLDGEGQGGEIEPR